MPDIASDLAQIIATSRVFGGSDNVRHGRYRFVIRRIFADRVSTDAGEHRFAFVELTTLLSEPNPQFEGDFGADGKLKDDGMHPNAVGSNCALKVDFDGPGGRSAPANIKAFILGLFGKRDGEISDAEVNSTWVDLSRQKDLKVGDAIGIDPQTNQPILAKAAKRANPACGMVIGCYTVAKKKRQPNDKGAYITKLIWTCVAVPGTGENAPELVAKRRAEIEANQMADDDEEAGVAVPSSPNSALLPQGQGAGQNGMPPHGPHGQPNGTTTVAAAPPPPPAPSLGEYVPPAPWVKHPSAAWGQTPETQFYWDQGQLGNVVKSAAQIRAGQ